MDTPLKDAIEIANESYMQDQQLMSSTTSQMSIPSTIEMPEYTITTYNYPSVLDKLDLLPKPFSYRATRKKLVIMFDKLEFASHKKKNELADKIYRFMDTLDGDESYYDICVLWGKFK